MKQLYVAIFLEAEYMRREALVFDGPFSRSDWITFLLGINP